MELSLESRTAALLSDCDFDSARFAPLFEGAKAELDRHLRPGVDPRRDCPDAFAYGISLLMQAALITPEDSPSSFTVGSVTLCSGEEAAAAQELRRQAFRLLRPWFKEPNFAFRSVTP